jgi:hypothetical protein
LATRVSGHPDEGEHEGDNAAREEPGCPGERFADFRDQVAPEGRAKTFSGRCPDDPPDQDARPKTHCDHGEDPSRSPPDNGIDQPPEQHPDQDYSCDNEVLTIILHLGREEPGQHR